MTLANIAAASDITAFTVLESQGLASGTIQVDKQMELPMDDESVALRMGKAYQDMGLPQEFAYNRHDDPLEEFGGTRNLT